jgi:hypothetical protein
MERKGERKLKLQIIIYCFLLCSYHSYQRGLSLMLNIFSVLTGWAREFFELIAPFHPGYTHTLSGALISTFWMFVYGYVVGAVFVLIYNSLAKE